jgi:site-specific DNA-methyltransferase (adenine-specific)
MRLNRILQGDCLEKMAGIPNDTFDMSFADPPFNLDKGYDSYKDSKKEDKYFDWCADWMGEMVRITKPSGSIFLHNIPKWLVQYTCHLADLATFKNWISWDAPTSPMGNTLQPAHYGILYYVKDESQCKFYEMRYPHKRCRDKKDCNLLTKDYGGKKHTIHPFGPLVSDVWTDIHRCKHDRYKDKHPCQLPVHLMERLVLFCTDEGDSVFDPFAGTGTTLIAARRLGRKYLGIELSEQYAKIAADKLAFEKTPSKLNDIWVSCYLNRIHTARESDISEGRPKQFKEGWKELFTNWPDTDDKRRALNTSDLAFTKEVKNKISKLCRPKKKVQKDEQKKEG